jgi:hypothetical protein
MTFNAPGSYITDDDNFAPPTFGGAVAVKYGTVAHTDTTAKDLFTLPEGAVVVGITVNVSTAFTDTGTNLLDIGISGTGNYYANDLNVATVGQIVTGMQVARLFEAPLEAPSTVTATFIGQNADAGAGLATVCFFYITR